HHGVGAGLLGREVRDQAQLRQGRALRQVTGDPLGAATQAVFAGDQLLGQDDLDVGRGQRDLHLREALRTVSVVGGGERDRTYLRPEQLGGEQGGVVAGVGSDLEQILPFLHRLAERGRRGQRDGRHPGSVDDLRDLLRALLTPAGDDRPDVWVGG